MSKTALSELAEITMGQSPSGKYCGANINGVPLLNGPAEFTEYYPIPVQYTSDPKKLSKRGDILFCVRGSTTGRMNWSDKEYAIGRGLAALRHKKGKEYNHYLKYLISNNLDALLNNTNGSTFPNITSDLLASFSVYVPDFGIQNKISYFLATIDAKIELNNRINTELETMAKTLYNYWFVQFDFPDANGKPYKTTGGKMVYNLTLKREIPEGWEWKEVSKLVEVRDGTHDSPKKAETGKYLITSKHLKKSGINFSDAYFISEKDFVAVNKRSNVDEGDFLLSMIGTVGLTNWVMKITTPFAIKNIGLFKTSQSPEWSNYIYAAVNSVIGRAYLKQNLSTGTSQPYVTLGALRSIPIVIPTDNVFNMFNDKIRPIHNVIYEKNTESQELVKLRDWFLPMLINGQITIKGILGEDQE